MMEFRYCTKGPLNMYILLPVKGITSNPRYPVWVNTPMCSNLTSRMIIPGTNFYLIPCLLMNLWCTNQMNLNIVSSQFRHEASWNVYSSASQSSRVVSKREISDASFIGTFLRRQVWRNFRWIGRYYLTFKKLLFCLFAFGLVCYRRCCFCPSRTWNPKSFWWHIWF